MLKGVSVARRNRVNPAFFTGAVFYNAEFTAPWGWKLDSEACKS
jgi:hypothetical protein